MNEYKVTGMSLFDNHDKLKAFANVTMNDCVLIKGVKVVQGEKGLYVSMPAYADKKSGKYFDQVFPVTQEDRNALNKSVLEAYNEQKVHVKTNADKASDITARVFLNTREDISNVLGTASVTVGNGLAINGIRIMKNSETQKAFLSYPSFKDKDGNYQEVCNPVTKAMHDKIEGVVLDEYQKTLGQVVEKGKNVAKEKDMTKQQQAQKQAMKATEAAMTL